MEFRLLGPLEVTDDGAALELSSSQQRALLAALLLAGGRPVSRDRLIDDIWGERPPETAAKMIQIYVSQLRKLMPRDVIETTANGYAIELGEGDRLDVEEFDRIAGEGRAAAESGDHATAADRLRAALALWRGEALADLPESFAIERAELEERRLAAIEDRIDAELAIGRTGELAAELETLVRAEPLRERLRAQQMLALYRSGRQSDALAAYRDAHRLLDEQLGIAPSQPLRDLERRILEQDPSLEPAGAQAAPSPPPPGETRYLINDGASIAYRVYGDGPLELVLITGWVLPMEIFWDHPDSAAFMAELGRSARVLVWDKRGTGLSDRVAPGELPSIEARMSDLEAVIAAAGFNRPSILGISEGAALAATYASTHPDGVRSLIIYGGWATLIGDEDFPEGAGRDRFDRFVDRVRDNWDDPADLLKLWAPSRAGDEALLAWWGRALRLGASPTAAELWLRMSADVDVRDRLARIEAPALVLHRGGDTAVPAHYGQDLASRIPGARFEQLDGDDHLWCSGDASDLLGRITAFLCL